MTSSNVGRKKAGFSLLETMVSTALLGVLLGVVAVLCNQYTRLNESGSARDRILNGAEQAFLNLRADIGASVLPPDRAGYKLRLLRVNPLDRYRYNGITPETPPAAVTWEPHDAPRLIVVGYTMGSEGLVRVVEKDGAFYSNLVATGVSGLDFAEDPNSGLITVTLSFVDERGRLSTPQASFARWLRW